MINFRKPNLLVLIILAIIAGVACGSFFSYGLTRVFVTFNSLFSNFLGFCIPLIILGFVAPAIADLGRGAGKMLLVTVALAYGVTLAAGFISYLVSDAWFPEYIGMESVALPDEEAKGLEPFFSINIPPFIDIISALALAFILGIALTRLPGKGDTIKSFLSEFREVVSLVIRGVIIPLLPLYIFGIFLKMTVTGEVNSVLTSFYKVILVVFALHLAWLLILYMIGAAFSRGEKNPFKLLRTMLPAYFTALGTSSSAATIPVTLRQTIKMGVDEDIAGFTVPLCATIDLSGSALKIVACAVALMIMKGIPYDIGMFSYFVAMLGIALVAAPGVPGGSIMAALALLTSILGFGENDCALMIALYIAMDSFGTACNVTGDGAIALIVDRFFAKKKDYAEEPMTSSAVELAE